MKYSASILLSLLSAASAAGNSSYVFSQVPGTPSTVSVQAPATTVYTTVVDTLTTYCSEPTTLTTNGKTYTVTEATTLTISDCPCTLTKQSTVTVTSSCPCTRTIDNTVTSYETSTTLLTKTMTAAKNSPAPAAPQAPSTHAAPAAPAPASGSTGAPAAPAPSKAVTGSPSPAAPAGEDKTTVVTVRGKTITVTVAHYATLTVNNAAPTPVANASVPTVAAADVNNNGNPAVVVPSNSSSVALVNGATKLSAGCAAGLAVIAALL